MEESVRIAAGLVLLFAGAEAFVRGSSSLGRRIGLTPLAVGLTIVAFGTSAPELAVSVGAALRGYDGLALGNVVGSNICNVALILGLCAAIRPLRGHVQLMRIDVPLMLLASIGVCALFALGTPGFAVGAILLGGLAIYAAVTIRQARSETEAVQAEFGSEAPAMSRAVWLDGLLVTAGLATLVAGSRLLVSGAAGVAGALGVDPAVVGLTVVALGTSLPELASSLVAALRGNADVAIGNVVGSNLFNLLGVLGATGLVHPMTRSGVGWIDLGVMVGFAALLSAMLGLRGRIGRGEGLALLTGYVAYLGWQVS